MGRTDVVRHLRSTTNIGRYDYTYDAVGNPTLVEGPGGPRTYRYDAQDRLIERCHIQACVLTNPLWLRYTYDKVGNRLTERDVTGTTTHSYDADDRLLSSVDAVGSTTYAHAATVTLLDPRTGSHRTMKIATPWASERFLVPPGTRLTLTAEADPIDSSNFECEIHVGEKPKDRVISDSTPSRRCRASHRVR